MKKAKERYNEVRGGGGGGSGSSTGDTGADEPSRVGPVTQQDVYQYRYQFGTNLGAIFVLEKWLFNRMFDASAGGGSEHDAVVASLRERGLEATRQRWQEHWRNALTDSDITFLRDTARCNMVRLPVGYFTLGSQFCPPGTPFNGQPSQVYDGIAWPAVLELCARLAAAGIGVLLDLHAVPGGANGNDHSGTTTGKAAHWEHRSLRDLSRACLQFMAGEIGAGKIPNAAGLQFCNEACHGAAHMYSWYEEVAAAVHASCPTLPLYVSDAWDLKGALKWATGLNSGRNCSRACAGISPVVVDVHKYYTFSESDRNQSPQQIIARIPGALKPSEELAGSVHDRGAAQCFVGEWSCVLDGRTWSKASSSSSSSSPSSSSSEQEKAALERQFGRAQCDRWAHTPGCGGSAFWTAKMQWMDGGGWGFFQQVKSGNIAAPAHLSTGFDDLAARLSQASELKDELKAEAAASHHAYWDRTSSPGKRFEHWRFEQGWHLGFEDALAFAGMRSRWQGRMGAAGFDRIGMLEIWIWRRMGESGARGDFVWEWEQGFRQGVKAAEGILGV